MNSTLALGTLRVASLPPLHDKAVVLCCDQKFLPYALFMATQLRDNVDAGDFDIVICSLQELEVPSRFKNRGFRFCQIAMDRSFEALKMTRLPLTAYMRLVLAQAFAREYTRILYLDCDMFVESGDISRLLGIDLGSHPVGAVRDNLQWKRLNRRVEDCRRLGLSARPFLSSGFLLIDVEAYISAGVAEACIAFGRDNVGTLTFHDQSLLNYVLRDNWAELSPLWNWQLAGRRPFYESVASPHIVHFIGNQKPWNDAKGIWPMRYQRQYHRFFSNNFPELARHFEPVNGYFRDRNSLRGIYARHFFSVHLLNRYLDRFENEYQAIA